ncbi:MAG: HAD family hydrolase [Nanoarchaeota archaeon]
MKVALFDLFGTLADAQKDGQRLDPEYALIKEFNLASLDDKEFYDRAERVVCGVTPYHSEEQYVRDVMEGIGIQGMQQNISKVTKIIRSQGELAQLLPGAIDVLEQVGSMADKVALISNAFPPAIKHLEETTGLFNHFDHLFLSYERGTVKQGDNGGLFSIATNDIGFKPDEAIMIGDNLRDDIGAAYKLGIAGVWIDRKAQTDRIARWTADHKTSTDHVYATVKNIFEVVDPVRRFFQKN